MQKFRAPPNPFPSQKKLPASDPLAAELADRINSSQGASVSGQDRSGSDASDDWEEVCFYTMLCLKPQLLVDTPLASLVVRILNCMLECSNSEELQAVLNECPAFC